MNWPTSSRRTGQPLARWRRSISPRANWRQHARTDGRFLGRKAADSDAYFYPTWTFPRNDGQVVVKPGVAVALRVLRGLDGWTIGVFLRMRAPEFGDLTPEEWNNQRRDLEVLADYANVLAAETRRP